MSTEEDSGCNYRCVPRGLPREKFKEWLYEDPAHCDALKQEFLDIAAGKFGDDHPISAEFMREHLDEHLKAVASARVAAMFRRMKAQLDEENKSMISDPDRLAQITKMAGELRDFVLDQPQFDRAMLTTLLADIARKTTELSTPEMLTAGHFNEAKPKIAVFQEAVKKWGDGDRSPEHIAHCRAIVEDLIARAEHFSIRDREALLPFFLEFRAALDQGEGPQDT